MSGRIRGQISENRRCSQGFSHAREFSQTLPRFSPGCEGTVNMFYFFYKIIIFCLNKAGPAEHGGLGGCSPPPPTFLQSNENENGELFVSLKKALNQPPTQNFVPPGLQRERLYTKGMCILKFLSWNCNFSQLDRDNNNKTELTILLSSFSCFIALWKHTCRPIKAHILSKLFYKFI